MEKSENLDKYLSLLNEEQLEAVVHSDSPLLILAGAGSGKTRVITTKIAYLINKKNVNPYSILAVTFTKKAANEMKERAISIEPLSSFSQIRTFHSFGSWFLRKYSDEAGLESSFTVYDDDDMNILVKKAVPSLSKKDAKLAAHQISLCKDYFLTPNDDLSIIGSEFDLNKIYDLYQKRLRSTGNADFGDLIMLPALVMNSNHKIADEIHNRFKVIMVDEYQDSNIAQYKLLQTLSGTKDGYDNYVCVVGDDDQSIYKFRGAEVQNILTFPQKFPGTKIIKLEKNYRSTAKILNVASLVVGFNKNRLGKTLIAQKGAGKTPVLVFLPGSDEEATFCYDLISKSVLDGAKYSDWAILYRTNAQSLNFEKQFLRRKIPYRVVGSLKFYEREEIKDALSYLSLFANPKDEISFRRVINKPPRGIGEKTQDVIMLKALKNQVENSDDEQKSSYENLLETTKECSKNFAKKTKEGIENFIKIFENVRSVFDENKSLSEFVQRMIMDSGLDEYHKASDEIEGTQRTLNLEELVNSANSYKCTMEGLLEFLDSINLDRSLELLEDNENKNAVTLITLHNTKGLEFNKVIITGLEEGVFPRVDKVGTELEEERRLFYVGITRAKDELYVTSVAKRVLYGHWEFMRPSRFVQEAKDAFRIIGASPYSFANRSYTSFNSSQLSSSNEDPIKEELLKKWKKGTKIYHDDYGYGQIIECKINENEVVCTVLFEIGKKKKFLPQYQAKSLMIVR